MGADATRPDGTVALSSEASTVPLQAGAAGLFERLERGRARPVLRLLGPVAGHLALTMLVAGALVLVALSTAGPSVLVPRSTVVFPGWEAGPLHALLGHISLGAHQLDLAYSGFLLIMTGVYAVAILAARSVSMRTIAVAVIALNGILLFGGPVQLTDLFNYLGYARLGALHHVNPYRNGIAAEWHDPVFAFTTWRHLKSPYGPLFTALSYPLGLLPLSAAYWALKAMVVAASLAFVGLVWKCARLLGRDPRLPVLFVAANPIYLFYAIGGFHNDFFMLVPATAAIALLLARRDRAAGAALMLAIAVKFTAVLLLPFLLIAARPSERRLRVLTGTLLAAVPLVAMSLALFGPALPNLQDQSTLLTAFSIPNLFGLAIGVGGGTELVLRLANVGLLLLVVLLLRRRRDWLAGAGWATLGLIASLTWLMPWYIVWVLPLAALGRSMRLRVATLALTAFLALTFMPATWIYLTSHRINPLDTPVGEASHNLQLRLEN